MNGTTATRMLDYFHHAFPVDNTSAAQYPDITVRATTDQGAVSEAGGHAFVPRTPEAFVHDDDGNLLSDGRWEYTWNGENRLIQIEAISGGGHPPAPVSLIEYEYDYQGRRVRMQVYGLRDSLYPPLLSDVWYVWDGWTLVAEISPVDASPVRRYLWNPSGRGGHKSLAAVRLGAGTGAASPPAQFAVVDANANVSVLLNGASGAASPGGGAPEMSAVYEYGPFGEPLRATGPLAKANPVRFSSELLDTATGCYYYGYRYYNPDTGRWLSRDPIGEKGGVNLYGAAQNDLINHNDVLGLAFLNFDSPALTLWTGSGFDQSSKKTRCGNPVRTWKAVSGGSDKPPVPGGWYLLTRFMALGDEMPNELNVRSERSFWKNGIYWQGTMAAWDGLAGEEFGAEDPVNPYPGFDLLYGYRPKRSEACSDIERKNVEYKIGLRGTYGNMVSESSAYRIHPKDRTVTSGCIEIQGYLHSTSFLSEVEGSVGAITLYVGRLNCCGR